jgi:ribose transport system substrate-binding protein
MISGINVSRVKILTYAFCGLLAATGGILMTAQIGVATPTAATGYELYIIAAAIIGGTSLFGGQGSALGVLLGAVFLQVLRNVLVLFGFPAYWQNAAVGAVILLTILLDYWQRKLDWSRSRKNRTGKNHIQVWHWVLSNKRNIVLGLVVMMFFSFLVNWRLPTQSDQKKAVDPSELETLTIAWIPKALDNPVFELGRLGAVQRAAELSQNGPVEVEILYVGSVTSDPAEQVRIIEDTITRKVDAIAISCNDPTACIYPINQAVEAGIPVMTWDADSPGSRRFAYLGLDNYQAGIAAADLLVTAMGQQGEVAILTGVPGAYNLEERIRGFKDGIVYFPEIEIVTTVYCDDDINLGVQLVEETMQVYPHLNGWFFTGLWPLMADRGSMPLWENAVLEGSAKTVAFDTLPVELELLRDDYLSGLVGQKYWSWGYDTVQIVYDHLINGQAYPTFISSGMDIVTSNNVESMLEAWRTNDFSQPLPPP